jgi:hypothetical protein
VAQTEVEIVWRHEITNHADPDSPEGKLVRLDRRDPTYQEYLRAVLQPSSHCPAQCLGTRKGSITVFNCMVANYMQCCDSGVSLTATREIKRGGKDGEIIETKTYDVLGVTEEECRVLREEIRQGRVDFNRRPDQTLSRLVAEGRLSEIRSPRLRERSEEIPERRATPALTVLLQPEPRLHVRTNRGNGDGSNKEEPILTKIAA